MAKISALYRDNEGVVFTWVPGDTSNTTVIPPSASHLPQLRNSRSLIFLPLPAPFQRIR